ncbi:MAG TPA: YetF domain-containing protein [Thermomicrobiales bacterium]|nr:YetF domain-containing protein [Thermomicrobiales bacterium]
MDSVVRAAAVYLVLLLLFRIVGKRSLGETGAFDFVLLLIIAEATQQAMIDDDNSMTNAFLIIVTLLALNIGFSILKQRSPLVDRLIDDVPVLIVVDGNPIKDRMDRARVDERDILQAARETQGLARLDEIKYAVLERDGAISVVPKQAA